MAGTYGSMLSRIRQAKKNGTRLHLDMEHVGALLEDDIYALLCRREAAELRAMNALQTEHSDVSEEFSDDRPASHRSL